MKLNKVAIACFKKDLFLLRTCVASIRYWYPNIEIFLIKDYIQGKFSTDEIERTFDVKIFPTKRKFFGWPWSKLAVVFHDSPEKFLFLDSDTVLLGRVIDKLNSYSEDFIVTGIQENTDSFFINKHYIDMNKIKQFDPSYNFPGFGFNGGQIVMSAGMLKEEDFLPVIELSPVIKNKYPDIFKHGDQGVLNYVFAKAHQKGSIKLRYDDFWLWPAMPKVKEVTLDSIAKKEGVPYVLHWAGIKPVDFREMTRYDIFRFYEKYYYRRVKLGKLKYSGRFIKKFIIFKLKILKYTLLKIDYKDM